MKQLLSLLFILCLLVLSLIGCRAQPSMDSAPTPTAPTESTAAIPASADAVTEGTQPQPETAKDTPQASSEPYALRHTVHDFSAQLPSDLPKTIGGEITNLYANDAGLHMYVNNRQTAQASIYTFSPGSAEAEVFPVSKIENNFPRYAHRLSDHRLIVVAKKNYHDHLFLTEENGNIIAECAFYNSTAPDGYVISEEENGDILVLIGSGQYLDLYRYDADTAQLAFESHYDQSGRVNQNWFDITAAQSLGSCLYYCADTVNPLKLDMTNGSLKAHKLRVPEDRGTMQTHIGADQNIYLSDSEGLYLYSDDIPTKVLDFTECNIKLWDYTMWIVNDHTFFFVKTKEIDGETHTTLQRVTTERIPYTDTRAVIHITGFETQKEWLTNAIFTFNQTSPDYRVDLRLINTVDRASEDIQADLAELMLYGEHPDILLMTPTVSQPLDLYYEKNVFVDLMPYFGDKLLGCAVEGMTYNGALYTLPTTMQLQTFVCAERVTDTALTWETFYSVMDSVSVPDSILTTEPDVIKYIYENGIMDFCDIGRAESYYNTDAFRDMLTYHARLDGMIDEAVGVIERAVDQSYGYTRAALPAYLQEGRIRFLNVPVSRLNDLLAPQLLYGDTAFTWCGYPSRDGGGARIDFLCHMFSVFADSDVLDGCIAFLSYLLSDELQCQPTLSYLPVTESGLRTLMSSRRYWYYDADIYEKYSDPNAELVKAPFYGVLSALQYIPTRAAASSAEPLAHYENDRYVTVELTDNDADAFIAFLNSCHMKANVDRTLHSIVTEELSYWENNARTLEETTKIIDSRVWIYLNE